MKKEVIKNLMNNANDQNYDIIIESVKKVRKKYEVTVKYLNEDSNEINYDINKYLFLSDTIISYSIFKDKGFETKKFEEILLKEEYFKLLNSAFNLLSFKQRSEYELITKLKEKTIKMEIINDVIVKLKQLGYINDYDYAYNYTNMMISKLKGPNVIKANLRLNKVDESIIIDALSQYTYQMKCNNIDKIIDKTISKLYKYPINKQKQRLINTLVSQGYSNDVINDRLQLVKFECDITNNLQKDIEKVNKKYNDKKYMKYSKSDIKQKKIASLLLKGYSYSDIKDKIN